MNAAVVVRWLNNQIIAARLKPWPKGRGFSFEKQKAHGLDRDYRWRRLLTDRWSRKRACHQTDKCGGTQHRSVSHGLLAVRGRNRVGERTRMFSKSPARRAMSESGLGRVKTFVEKMRTVISSDARSFRGWPMP